MALSARPASSSDFNPRSLHGERPATLFGWRKSWKNFNPRSLHGERPLVAALISFIIHFNPRSLHGERPGKLRRSRLHLPFQSTLPARGATYATVKRAGRVHISIHAPCTGSDPEGDSRDRGPGHFNPRSLHGERREFPFELTCQLLISIHAPCTWSDCNLRGIACDEHYISIHAPCTGSDLLVGRQLLQQGISIHAPCTGSDSASAENAPVFVQFQSTLPARGATAALTPARGRLHNFNPRSLHGERLRQTAHAAGADDFNPRSLHGERQL